MTEHTVKNVNGVDVPLTDEEIAELNANDAAFQAAAPAALLAALVKKRQNAYARESDPLAIKAQRLEWLGDPQAEIAKQAYLAKVAEIQVRYPYPGS
jgi:hypothetical protein